MGRDVLEHACWSRKETLLLIGVYLLQVASPECSGDVEFPLHSTADDGVAIIMFGLDPIYLLYRPDSNKHKLIMVKTQINASH